MGDNDVYHHITNTTTPMVRGLVAKLFMALQLLAMAILLLEQQQQDVRIISVDYVVKKE